MSAMIEDAETWSENRPTKSMFPVGDGEYARAPRDGSRSCFAR